MKYTDEQRAILALCRKYKGVKVEFRSDGCIIRTKDDYLDSTYALDTFLTKEWLDSHATLKQVGRPKGSVKTSRKVRKFVSLSADQWSKVEGIQRMQGLKYASHAIGLAVEAFSKNKTAYEIQSQIGNDCCICKHVEYCPNATWETDKLNTCSKWQLATSTFSFDGLKKGGE